MRDFDIIHKVIKGETLAIISKKYNVPINIIIKDNKLDGEIYEGQRLLISSVSGEVYTVKPTDTLIDIAKKFNTEKDKILKDNNINMIYPFMSIIIK